MPLPEHLVVTDEEALDDGAFFNHWISVDARHLPRPLPGCISVYLNEGDGERLLLHDPDASLRVAGGTLLYAHPSLEWPHVDALFHHGSPGLQAWVARELGQAPEVLRSQSDIGAHRNFSLSQLDQVLRADHPMWTGSAAAQLGGWCWGWPDEAWDERENAGQQLMLVTYERSEPWLEVWWTGQDFEVAEHLT